MEVLRPSSPGLGPGNAGLSKLGHATIARIEKERMLVDFSHGGQRTIAEGLAATTRTPIISHTGCRSLHDNPRNVWDAEMKACADKGGVVGVYWMPFLVPHSRPTGADLIRHMDHVKNLCGEEHVSIGTDGVLSKTKLDDKARAAQKKPDVLLLSIRAGWISDGGRASLAPCSLPPHTFRSGRWPPWLMATSC